MCKDAFPNRPTEVRRPRLRIILALALVTGFVSASPIAAQRPSGGLTGVIRDSVSMKPLEKLWACAQVQGVPSYSPRCVQVDSAGRYRLDSLPPLHTPVRVMCTWIGRQMGILIGLDTIPVPVSGYATHDMTVPTTGCDPRPVRRVKGIFRGHYTPGFESSEFIPCPSDSWIIPGDSIQPSSPFASAWATWPDKRFSASPPWPKAPRGRSGNATYFVRWRGTVVGPGNYGHMGMSGFEFMIDSLLEIRAPGRRDCR
jgi:hypothetical protein